MSKETAEIDHREEKDLLWREERYGVLADNGFLSEERVDALREVVEKEPKWINAAVLEALNADVVGMLNQMMIEDNNLRQIRMINLITNRLYGERVVQGLDELIVGGETEKLARIARRAREVRSLCWDKIAIIVEIERDEKLAAWLGEKRLQMAQVHKFGDFAVDLINLEIIPTRQKEKIFSLFSVDELVNLVVVKRMTIAEIGEHINIIEQIKQNELTWDRRIAWIIKLSHYFGRGGVSDEQMNEMVWAVYRQQVWGRLTELKQKEATGERLRRVERNEMEVLEERWEEGFLTEHSIEEKLQKTQGLRASLTAIDKKRLREFMQARGRSKLEHVEISEWMMKAARRRMVWRESGLHPLAHLQPLIGFEVEFSLPAGVGAADWAVLDLAGITQGKDRMEMSPGPFYDPITAESVWMLLNRYEWINLYEKKIQTFHFNLGVKECDEQVVNLVRLLQTTGYAYWPVFNEVIDRHDYEAKIEPKEDLGHGNYVEGKEFDVVTGVGVCKTLRLGSRLGAALWSYQKVQAAVVETEVSMEERELAGVWAKLMRKWREGLFSCDLREVTLTRVPRMKIRTWGNEIQSLLLTRESRVRSARSLGQGNLGQIEIDGKKYKNLVDMARSLCWEAASEANKILNKAEDEFIIKMTYLREQKEKDGWNEEIEREVETLFNRFPCGLDKRRRLQRRDENVEQIREHAEQIWSMM